MLTIMSRKKIRSGLQNMSRKLVASVDPKSIVSEQFRTIRTNINFSLPDEELKTILVTSASSGDGKSTVVANIAVVFAQEGKRVLLIDGDMRKPTVHYTFHTTNTVGLSNLLTRQKTLLEVIQPSRIAGLDLVTCGPIPPNPAELIGSRAMNDVLKEMKDHYDIVLIDAPPVLTVTDAQILSNKCDGTLLIVNAGKTEKESMVKAHEALVSSQATIIGSILNNYKLKDHHDYYQYYRIEE